MRGLILFAHGARDPRWAEPLHRLNERITRARPATPVAIAYLELMAPDLPTAAAELVASGCIALSIVPIFLGQGGHVRRDLAALVDALAAQHPNIEIQCVAAVGEDEKVLDAMAAYCMSALTPDKAIAAADRGR